ncbi:ankyrin repeat domain-containing protein [Aspergillus mulundensis]|uniref:Uncharacterized protein n=1 Tax=Aspergillus mulundensis TaxID=1810919 RepID=A0A3D8QZN5_9EURO|nr:Uncharacterized protein DSM5745_09115 [Aspergillus mulundensis]RDW67249.1 Uncharacterized protein DSM5745_09115 [Aspergillus mulundensis]
MSFNDFNTSADELIYAAETGDVDALTTLLNSGVSPRIGFRQPLMAAILNNHTSAVKLLLTRGALDECLAVTSSEHYSFPESGDITCSLHFAALHGKVDVVKMLLGLGISVDCVDGVGRTALGFAARAGRIEVVRLLVQCGADLGKVDREGLTALDHAAAAVEVGVIEFLRGEMKRQAKIKAKV